MADDRIQLNLVLNEATVSAVEGRVRNLVNRLNNQNISLNINGRNLDNIVNRLNDIQQRMRTINSTPVNINANLTSAQQQYRLETERMRVSQQLELSRQRTLQTENQAISALAQQNRTLTVNNNVTHQIQQNTQNIGNNMNVAGGHARDFVDYLSDGVRYLVTYRSLYAVMNQIGEAFSEMKNVDTAAIQVRKTTGMSKDEIEAIKKASYGVATEYGRSASEYLESVSEFARAGYKQHSTELGKLSLLTQNVGDVSAESANKMLLAVDAAYQLEGNVTELTNVVNALNNIANKNPTSMQKMADGLQVSASMAKTAGMDISELTALIGTGTAVTQREGAEVARAIRTIVMNVKSVKGELEDGTIIDDKSIAKAQAALKGVGISTKEVVNGVRELRNPMEVLDELADKWHTLGTEAQSVLTESIANRRQANVLSGILDNWSMVEKMQTEYFNSANSAIEENILYLEGWEAKSKVVSAKWTEYISNLADTKVITGTLDALYGLLTALDTPIGRIVTQIVIVNTALAVTGRLWQQIRARSIVAEILSIGVADRQLGTAIGLVTQHLGRQALAWATSPFGMATIAVAGITLITSAIEKNSQKLEENAQKAGEAYDKVKQNMNELDDLIKQYNDLQISNEWDNTPVETKKQLHEDINKLLGDEADKVDILNGKYKETTEELFKQRMSKSSEEEQKAFDNEQEKGKYLWESQKGLSKINFDTGVPDDFVKKYIHESGISYDFQEMTLALNPIRDFNDLLATYDTLKEMTKQMYEDGYGDSNLYKAINGWVNDHKEKVEAYRLTLEELNDSKLKNQISNYINQNVGGYIDNLEEYKRVVEWVNDNFSGEDKDNALGFLNSYFSEYAEKVDTTTGNINKMTASLSEMKSASENISTLQKAFKELSDDGYITTKTLGEIQTATGLSEDEWGKYQNALMSAEYGTNEFNQIMSELTHKILDNTFAGKDLNDVTKDQIEAVLRENGVVNASAVAHDWLTRSKEKERIETELVKASTSEEVVALAKEALQAGITGDALNKLIIETGIFNNTNLDVSQKVAALQEMGYYARWTAEQLEDIDRIQRYSFGGKDYIASYGKDGKLLDVEQVSTVDIPDVDVPESIIPEYSGSDKSQKDLEKERLKNTRDYVEKVSDIKEDLAEKIEDINEDLAEKEAEFAENMQEAWEEERYESLKEDLDKRRDLLDKYEKDLDTYDFGLDLIDDKDFDTQESLLNRKLQTTMEYSAKLKEEFDRLASLTPQTGKEAQEVADAIGEIGEKLRQNATTIRETTTALYEAKLGQITSLADGQISALEHEINRIDRLIDIVRNTDDDYGKYTEDLLFADVMFGSLTTTNNKELKERKKKDNELIKQQEETQATINEIVTKSLNQQIEDNKAAREKERQNLIDDMEKTRQDAMEKLEEAKQEAAEKIADATEDFQEKMSDISNSTIDTTNTVSEAFTSSFAKVQETIDGIDTTNYKEKINEVISLANQMVSALSRTVSTSVSTSINPNSSNVGGGDLKSLGMAVVPAGGGVISSYYGMRYHPVDKKWKMHYGTDYPAPWGSPIYAYASGTVSSAGYSGVYGNNVYIDHGNGYKTHYSHASSLLVNTGDSVKKGQHIANVGSTGWSTGNHLDLECYYDGVAINPKNLPAFADGTPYANALSKHLGIAGENYKPEILIDKKTGRAELIDSPTVIDTSKTDVVGEKQTAGIPKFSEGTTEYELAVAPDGTIHIVGKDGIELADLPAETKILDQEKTAEILNDSEKLSELETRHKKTVSGRHQYILSDIIKQNESAMESDNANYLSMVSDVMSQYQSGELTDEEYDEALLGLKNTLIDMQGTTANDIAKTIQDAFVAWMKDVDSGVIDYDSEVAQMYFDEYTKYFDLAKEADEAAYETKHSEIERLHDEVMQQVSDLQHELDLATKAEPLFDPTSYYRQMQELYHNEAERLRSIDPEKYKDEIQQLQNQWWDAEDAIKDYTSRVFSEIERIIGRQTEALQERADAYDILINKNQALVDSESKFYETQKTIREAQREINNELNASKKLSAWMDEYAKQFLFNEKDYDVLSDKLKTLQKDTQEIYSLYQNQINQLTEDNWYLEEAITKEYERRLASKEREYEIARAELNLAKKQSELNNILAEKNVTMVVGGQLQQVADYQKLMEATEEVANLESELAEIRLTNEQQYALDTKRAHIDGLNNEKAAIENRIKMINDQTEEMRRAIEDFIEPLGDLGRLFEIITGFNIPGLDEELGALKHQLNSGSEYSFSLNPENKVVKVNPDGNAPKGLNEGDVVLTAGGAYRINGVNPDGSYDAGRMDTVDYSKVSGYASGTDNALKGWHKVNELGEETYIANDGTYHNFAGREIVFTKEESERLMSMIKNNYQPIPFNLPKIPVYPEYNRVKSDTNYTFNGDINIQNLRDYDDFLWQLSKHMGNKIKK